MPEAPVGRAVVDAFLRGDAPAVVDGLAPDATFHSPVADYRGRNAFEPVLTAVATVLRDAAAASVHEGDGETVAFFTASVDGRRADGVLRVQVEDGRRATDLTLMLRPLGVLLAGVEAMRRALGR